MRTVEWMGDEAKRVVTAAAGVVAANCGVARGVLAQAAGAALDGLFLEVHDNPAEAKSDGANSLRLDELKGLLERLLAIQEAARSQGTVDE